MLSVEIDEDLYEELRRYIDREGLVRRKLVAKIIRRFLDEQNTLLAHK